MKKKEKEEESQANQEGDDEEEVNKKESFSQRNSSNHLLATRLLFQMPSFSGEEGRRKEGEGERERKPGDDDHQGDDEEEVNKQPILLDYYSKCHLFRPLAWSSSSSFSFVIYSVCILPGWTQR